MKRAIIVGLLSTIVLSGCSTINDRYRRDNSTREEELSSQNTNIMKIDASVMDLVELDETEWKKFIDLVDGIDRDEDWRYDVWGETPYRAQMVKGVMKSGESLNFSNIDHENSKKVFELFEEQTGNDIEEFVEMGRSLDENMAIEKIIGGYGITIERPYEDYTNISITKPCMKLKDAAKEAWIEEICGDDLLFATISQGKEKQLYELSSPTFISDGGCYRENSMPVVNMQIITAHTGEVEKVRMIIKKGKAYDTSLMEETAFGPLHRVITSVKGNIEDQEMMADLMSALNGQLTHKKGVAGGISYEIKGEEFNDHSDQAIIELKF